MKINFYVFFIIFTFIISCGSFYLPGVAPRDYVEGEAIDLKVIKLTSPRTQLPYTFYSLPFCKPDSVLDARENLGEMLMGDRIENSLYTVKAKIDMKPCRVLCKKTYTAKDMALFAKRIKEEYRVNWLLDNLPSATKKMVQDSKQKFRKMYEDGFALGVKGEDGSLYINNHVNINILYHQGENTDKDGIKDTLRIVGFEVVPESVKHDTNFREDDPNDYPKSCENIASQRAQAVSGQNMDGTTIVWTYTVTFETSPIKWGSRWDVYLLMVDDQIHWFSIINSLMIVLFLTGMVAMIMIRTLRADLRRYNMPLDQDEIQEESGWKLVHGDVFRPPKFRMLLSVLCGTGIQIFGMYLITMVFAVLGFLSPANRGSLLTAMPVLFVVMGIFAGYFSALTYRMMGGQAWKKNTLMTAFFLPGIVFAIVLILNFFLLGVKSSGSIGFGTLFALWALWFGVSVPLVFFGSYFGYRRTPPEFPVRTNLIPRLIPEQVWYMKPIFSILMGGILPFGVVFIELFFILSSIWLQQFYYLFSFLFIVFLILIVTCAEITIVMCYFQLCNEDYHWWWRAYLTSGASAGYMFLYAVFYFITRLNMSGFVSALIYFGYTLIMATSFFVLTGTIGFYACFFFVKTIYGSVHLS